MTESSTPPVPPFRPARGLGNPHLQTVLGKLLRPRFDVPLRRERLETPDGDFLDLDFVADADWAPEATAPVVVVLHGLEGRSTRRYMGTTYRALLARGLRPVGMNFRGCSGEPNRLPRAYHSGETGDVRLVLEALRSRTAAPLAVVGYSLGGNVVLKLLGETAAGEPAGAEDPVPATERVAAGAAVSVPFDLEAGARSLEEGVMGGRVYTRYFLDKLRRKVLDRESDMADACDLEAVRRARTIREFDDAVTAPVFGFEDAADYYTRSSSTRYIPGIRTPTLVVHSRDDPFLPAGRIPEAALRDNPWVHDLITERGGHQGYIAGTLLRPRFWVEEAVAAWLADQLGVFDASTARPGPSAS